MLACIKHKEALLEHDQAYKVLGKYNMNLRCASNYMKPMIKKVVKDPRAHKSVEVVVEMTVE
jgi:hypothetical protein